VHLTYAGTTIIDGTALLPGYGWQLPMQHQADVVALSGAPVGTPYPRGNRTYSYGGSVSRTFDTEAAAVAFYLFHADSLPDSADLVVSVGATPIGTFEGAVLSSCVVDPPLGVSITVHYQFAVGAPAAPET